MQTVIYALHTDLAHRALIRTLPYTDCICASRAHDDSIIIAAEVEEHVTSYPTRGESRIYRVYYK